LYYEHIAFLEKIYETIKWLAILNWRRFNKKH
jgi:hypothetical protein